MYSYEEKLNWMEENGWYVFNYVRDEREYEEDISVACYENKFGEIFHWKEKDITELPLLVIKEYKKLYDKNLI